MYLTSTKSRKAIAIVTLALGAFATPAVGDSVADCYETIIHQCADAMEDANYLERFSLGLMCTGMLAGCGFEAI